MIKFNWQIKINYKNTNILSKSEDPTTDTELNAIAAAAIHG